MLEAILLLSNNCEYGRLVAYLYLALARSKVYGWGLLISTLINSQTVTDRSNITIAIEYEIINWTSIRVFTFDFDAF